MGVWWVADELLWEVGGGWLLPLAPRAPNESVEATLTEYSVLFGGQP